MNPEDSDHLLQLRGSGRDLWADEHADEYVRRVREGWDERTAWDIVDEEAENSKPPSAEIPQTPNVPQDDERK
jgi:hypothetical protein